MKRHSKRTSSTPSPPEPKEDDLFEFGQEKENLLALIEEAQRCLAKLRKALNCDSNGPRQNTGQTLAKTTIGEKAVPS